MFEREHSSLCGRSFHARHPQPGPSHRLLQLPLESVMSPTQPPTITIHRPAISHFYDVNYINDAMDRAVANGPVGPAMAGPIIEPANFILFFNFLKFFIIFFGRNNNRAGIFFDIIFETETTQSPNCAL